MTSSSHGATKSHQGSSESGSKKGSSESRVANRSAAPVSAASKGKRRPARPYTVAGKSRAALPDRAAIPAAAKKESRAHRTGKVKAVISGEAGDSPHQGSVSPPPKKKTQRSRPGRVSGEAGATPPDWSERVNVLNLDGVIFKNDTALRRYQRRWARDERRLTIAVKSAQIGYSTASAAWAVDRSERSLRK